MSTERSEWATERQTLLDRIQRPDLIHPAVVPEQEIPDDLLRELEADDIDLVGSIQVNGADEE